MDVRPVDIQNRTRSNLTLPTVDFVSSAAEPIWSTPSVDEVNSAGSFLFVRQYFTPVAVLNTSFVKVSSFGRSRLVSAIYDLNSVCPGKSTEAAAAFAEVSV
jgi:hypothetical protein